MRSSRILSKHLELICLRRIENNALSKEAEIRFQTTSAQLTILSNTLKDVAVTLGEALMPMLRATVDVMQSTLVPALRVVVETFTSLPGGVQGTVVAFGGLVAVGGPMLLIFGQLSVALGTTATALGVTIPAGAGIGATALVVFTGAAKAAWAALTGPVGWVIAGITAIGGAFLLLRDDAEAATTSVDDTTESLKGLQAQAAAFGTVVEDALTKEIRTLTENILVGAESMGVFDQRLDELSRATNLTDDQVRALADAARTLAEQGHVVTDQMQQMIDQSEALKHATDDSADTVETLSDAVTALIDQFQGRGLIQSALEAAEAVKEVGGVATLTADQQDQLRETMEGAIDAYRRLGQTAPPAVQTLSAELRVLERANQELARAVQRHQAINEKSIDQFLEMNRVGTEYVVNLDTLVQGTVEAEQATFDANQAFGHLETTVVESIKTTSQYEVALASLAGQLGGAAGQSLNLAISMREANKNLKDGEQGFSEIRIGAAKASAVFHTFGDAIGGTAGKILSEVGNIAQAFASGGLIGGIIAGVGAAIKGLKSLFGVSEAEKKARAFADTYADTIIKTLNDAQLAEAVDAALGAWRGNERGAQFLIGVRDGFVAAGRSAAEAEQLVGRYWKAVRDGSPDAVKAIEAQIDAVVKVGQAVQELQAFEQCHGPAPTAHVGGGVLWGGR